MAIRNKEDFMNSLKGYLKEDTSDEALALLEDANDTFDNFNSNSNIDWKQRFEDNDEQWRKKYKDAFFNGVNDEDEPDEPEDDKSKIKIEDLFTEVK